MAGFGAKVKLTVDRSSRAEFNKQINDLVGQIKISNKFTVLQKDMDRVIKEAQSMLNSNPMTLKVNKIDCSAAVTNVKKQLQTMLSSLSVSNGVNITGLKDFLGTEGVDATMKGAADAANAAVQKMNDAKAAAASWAGQMEVLDSIAKGVAKTYKSGLSGNNMIADEAEIQRITASYNEWAQKVKEIKASRTGDIEALQQEGLAIQRNITAIQNKQAEEAKAAAVEKKRLDDIKTEEAIQKRRTAALRAYSTLLTQMQKAERDWTAAKGGRTSGNYKTIQDDIKALQDYRDELDHGTLSVEEFEKSLQELRLRFSENSNAIKNAGGNTKTFTQRLGTLAGKFSSWLSVSQIIMTAVNSVRQMIAATIELDDAITQLKIVTKDSESAYTRYMDKISATAKNIGSSIPDLIDSSTTYARLGYSLNNSSSLAEFTAMLQNVGDIDVSDAQDAITSIVKAFRLDVDEIESVMDKLVVTGNNFPISVDQIAEGMTNASSALSAAGNTFEQSVALLTAANTTIQNASKSSTGLRTIAARIRGTATELEELGETMTEAQYGDLVAALTKHNVALTDINGEFRSTYDIIADIAKIWEDLSSMEQSALANAISGTRQQAVFFSMVEQFQEASGAMQDMANSAGTLQESYGTFMESTTAHINQFKAAFQSLADSTFSTDLMNGIIDAGTTILEIIEGITSTLGVLGTGGLALLGKVVYDISKSAGRPKIDGFQIVPAYTLAATRNELAA